MKIKDKNNLKKTYIETRDKLIKTLNNYDCEIDCDGDETDFIQANALVKVQNKLSANYLKQLIAVKKAIEQIDNDSYGVCEECDEEIGIKRLEAIPGITICICCAEQAEINK
jgi:DnaK suppressor protein